MTAGQERAFRELERLAASGPDVFQVVESPVLVGESLVTVLSLRIGSIETREGGIDLREREEFVLVIPPDFPFERPALIVKHNRFAGFPHVIWSHTICLFQSGAEWNPADGLYGFFDRLLVWLSKAAMNDMDPVGGPLEPPHHVTDFSQAPFVIRANAPVPSGEAWFGLAKLEKHQNRVELVGWIDAVENWPETHSLALAVVLSKPLPMEFPQTGSEFFKELMKQGLDRYRIIQYLALAALFVPEGQPIHLILGLPMRRASDGSSKLHVAVWTTDDDFPKALRAVLPEDTDTNELLSLRNDTADLLLSVFETRRIKWCRVLEDRPEIVVRRDINTPAAWFRRKKVLVVGCGALGSWAAEIAARATPSLMHLVDVSIVKPGLLARQNYRLDDIGSNKARALGDRLKTIIQGGVVQHFEREAHGFITEDLDRINNYDVVLDYTASNVFQMKIERDWEKLRRCTPLLISMIIDAKARRSLCVAVSPGSSGGIWSAYIQLKQRLCFEANRTDLVSAFYSDPAMKDMFQPEPGCSEPTFSGSAADVLSLTATALDLALTNVPSSGAATGIAISVNEHNSLKGSRDVFDLPALDEAKAGSYRVLLSPSVYSEVTGWVRQNARVRSPRHETGGLLWGLWDDAVQVIWVFDASGPPPDSQHDRAHFVCGTAGTVEEHVRRMAQTHGACGFLGFWHTHPAGLDSNQSTTDVTGMASLISKVGHNQRRAVMLIFGQRTGLPTAGIYVYESHSSVGSTELFRVGEAQISLKNPVL